MIFRYILGELISPLVLGVLVFSGILMGTYLFETMDLLLSVGIRFGQFINLIIALLPFLLHLTIPMALLLALMLTYGRLTENNEILALRSIGISFGWIMAPALVMGAVFFGIMAFWEHIVGPAAFKLERQTKLDIVSEANLVGLTDVSFNTQIEGYVIYVKQIHPREGLVEGLHIYVMRNETSDTNVESKTNEIDSVLISSFATVNLEGLETLSFNLLNGPEMHSIQGENHTAGTFEEIVFSLDVKPIIQKIIKPIDRKKEFTTPELVQKYKEYLTIGGIFRKDLQGREVKQLRELHSRFSVPALCLALPLIAVPMSLVTRSGRRSVAFAISIVMIFAYYLLQAIGKSMIYSGIVPPLFGCWIPVIVMGIVGLVLTRQFSKM